MYLAPSASADTLEVTFQGTDVKLGLVPFSDTTSLATSNLVNARYYVTVDGGSSGVASDLPRDASGQAFFPGSGIGDRGSGRWQTPIPDPRSPIPDQAQVVRGLASEFRR